MQRMVRSHNSTTLPRMQVETSLLVGKGRRRRAEAANVLCGIYTRLVVNTHAGAMLLAGTFANRLTSLGLKFQNPPDSRRPSPVSR